MGEQYCRSSGNLPEPATVHHRKRVSPPPSLGLAVPLVFGPITALSVTPNSRELAVPLVFGPIAALTVTPNPRELAVYTPGVWTNYSTNCDPQP